MQLEKKFYIHTGKDGILGDTNETDVRTLIATLKHSAQIVIHIHGGLVSKSRAMEKAERLLPAYQAASAHPVFIVWESGLIETVTNNLQEINKEKIFSILVKQVLKYAIGKLTTADGAKSSARLWTPTDIEVSKEFNKRLLDEEPFAHIVPSPILTTLDDLERNQFEDVLARDPGFQEELQAIVNGARPELGKRETTSKGAAALHQKSSHTLMSPEIVDELITEARRGGEKGILSTTKMALKAGKILARVIRRFLDKRDHGLYTTVVEEVLREFYIANVGSAIWGMMKQETADTFADVYGRPSRAGWFFVQELGKLLSNGSSPQVSVVAHSAGAVYASHLLTYVDWARAEQAHPLPNDFRLKNLILLAPACSFTLFDEMLARHNRASLFEHFRIFALKDELESGYWEVPCVYPRSLLYFVSGVVEWEADDSAYDLPLLGMQRYFVDAETYQQPAVKNVREFLSRFGGRGTVWSEADSDGGLSSDTLRHGEFDLTEGRKRTILSIQHILKEGW